MKRKFSKKALNLPVIIEKSDDGGYVGRVPTIRGCHTQADTLVELRKRLQEVAELCYEAYKNTDQKPVSENTTTIKIMRFLV
jgi:predicted RNase H-like HicB family nuclease